MTDLVKTNSWEEIEIWCQDLIDHGIEYEPMLNLIQHIRSSGLNERLYAITSLNELIVGIFDEIEWNKEVLHISFDAEQKKWEFKYWPLPNKPFEFERNYNEEFGIEKFDQFIKYIKW